VGGGQVSDQEEDHEVVKPTKRPTQPISITCVEDFEITSKLGRYALQLYL